MANIKSQKKRNKTNEKNRQANRQVKTSLRTQIRNFDEAIESGDADAAKTALHAASRELDKATSKGVIHANRASRTKSRMARRLNSPAGS